MTAVDSLARASANSLARAQFEALLVKTQPLDMLIRKEALAGSLSPADLIETGASAEVVNVQELERLLPDGLAGARLQELSLSRLIDRDTDPKIIKLGLRLLGANRYKEAIEWWTLQQAAAAPKSARFALLLMVLELITWTLAGEEAQAGKCRERVMSHPLLPGRLKRRD